VFGWLTDWCWWLVLIFCKRKVVLVGAGWLVLVLCEREILLAGCSEDEANSQTITCFI